VVLLQLLPREFFLQEGVGLGGVYLGAVGFHELAHGLAELFFGEGVFAEEVIDEFFGVAGGGFFGEVFFDDGELGFELGDFGGFVEFFVFFDALAEFFAVGGDGFFFGDFFGLKIDVFDVADEHAEDGEAVLLAGFHGGFHIFLEAGQ
jgi:hypothetical protein